MTPPRMARALLLRACPDDGAGLSIVGDLDEECAQRWTQHGARQARRWYWRTAIGIWWHAAWRHPATSHHQPRGGAWFGLVGDIRHALRLLRAGPAQTLLMVATLSVAIGVTTIGFSFADTVFLRGLPIAEPDKTVLLYSAATDAPDRRSGIYFSDYVAFRERAQSVRQLSAWTQTRATLRRSGGAPMAVTVSRVTGDLFGVWGFRTQLGRRLGPEDDDPGRPRVGVLSDRHWREAFGASPAAIGETVLIGDVPYEIVGVLPPEVEFSTFANIAMWISHPAEPSGSRDLTAVGATGRLVDGVTLAHAAAELAAIAKALELEQADSHRGRAVLTLRASRAMGGPNAVLAMTLLIGTSALVLVIASVNVAGVLLARAVSRQREFGLRMALGAGAARVLRQQVTEGALLAAISAIGGLIVAVIGVRLIHATEAEPILRQIALDWHELVFVAALTVVTPCLVVVAPVLAARRVDLTTVLNAGTARTGSAHTRARQVLVVAQLALAVMLTIVGSLAARSALEVMRVPVGFDPSGLVTFVLGLDGQFLSVAERRAAVGEIERLIESEGGLGAGAVERHPVALSEATTPVAVDTLVLEPGASGPTAIVGAVDAHGLSALGVPIIAGRSLTDADVDSGASFALISREAARRYFGDTNGALGRRLMVGLGESRREYQVVGVTGDVRYRQLVPRVWLPLSTPSRVSFVVRSNGDLARAVRAIRAASQRVAPDIPVESLEPYQTAIDRRSGGDRVALGMLVSCAALVLVFAATGLYGLVALSVNMRRAEFGVRFALGATSRGVVGMIVRQAFVLLAVGLALGALAGLLAANAMRRLLYGVTPFDPITLLFVGALLTLVTVAASVIPALRASRVSALEALRAD